MKLLDLPIGSIVTEPVSGIEFQVAEHGHAGWDGTALITNHVIAQMPFDAPEPENPDFRMQIAGNSDYALSNLHQWLNSTGTGWFRKSHEADTAPTEENLAIRPTGYEPHLHNAYADAPGFLSAFPESFIRNILDTPIIVTAADGSQSELPAKVFCPSLAELGITAGVIEGTEVALFHDFRNRYAVPSQDCVANARWQTSYMSTNNVYSYWLRTPKLKSTGYIAYVHFVNPYSYKYAACPFIGLRPMMNVRSDLEVLPTLRRTSGQPVYVMGGIVK